VKSEADVDVTDDDDEDSDDFADSVEEDDCRAEGSRETVAKAPARITAVRINAALLGTECEPLHLDWKGLWSLL
jgi:hypothetical protein